MAQQKTNININDFAVLNEIIASNIKEELKMQGHFFSGDLDRSIETNEINERNNVIIFANALKYIEELENFTPASKIGTLQIDFDRLKKWIIGRGIVLSSAQAETTARVIYNKWLQKGKPLPGSLEFSETGRVTEAIKISFNENKQLYDDRMEQILFKNLDSSFMKIDKKTIKI